MTDIILHHYEISPFSEKVHRILAYKQLPWFAVDQPVMMPKPDLVALTGGNRRIPAMQIGADIYCDTALIAFARTSRDSRNSDVSPGYREMCRANARAASPSWAMTLTIPASRCSTTTSGSSPCHCSQDATSPDNVRNSARRSPSAPGRWSRSCGG